MATPSDQARCGFLTDVEGNYEYFESYVAISKILEWEDKDKDILRFKDDNCYFVFGGDSQDKGTGDIRFVKAMNALKDRYPNRVFLIIGNRDANKLRLATELGDKSLESEEVLDDKEFPYWVTPDKRVTPAQYLAANSIPNTPVEQKSPVNRLKWLLKETMGADGAFDRRKKELAIIRKVDEKDIKDEDVVASYRDEVDPREGKENFMLKYLERAQLSYTFGQVIFVHGAVTKDNMGDVPGESERKPDVKSWETALNAWAKAQVEAFKADPFTGTNDKKRAGFGLMDYGVPNGNNRKTVVYDGNLSGGNPLLMDPAVKAFLVKSGISTVVCGHIPHGDCPTPINSGTVRVITADTSYSKMGNVSPKGWGVDNRGDAVSEVILWTNGDVHVHGRLADGQRIEYHLAAPRAQDDGVVRGVRAGEAADPYIGQQLRDEFWVKAKFAGDDAYLACHGQGFRLDVKRIALEEVKANLVSDRLTAPECNVEVIVKEIKGGREYISYFDKTDPFIRASLHHHLSRHPKPAVDKSASPDTHFQTSVKWDAGGNASFNETFNLKMPAGMGHLRFELWDKNYICSDKYMGWADLDLNFLWDGGANSGKTLPMNLHMLDADDRAEGDVKSQLGQTTCILLVDIKLTPVAGAAAAVPSASAGAASS